MTSAPNTILNIASYQFVDLQDCEALRERVFEAAGAHALKGTVLLATEGINLFLAGEPEGIHAFMAWLRGDKRFAGLAFKESWSDRHPFKRLLVKVKNEIIRMNHPTIRPQSGRAPSVSAATLARWLDQGHDDTLRPVLLLDTRNGFELEHGRFSGALDWGLSKFSEFPEAVRAHRAELEGKTVVSYCTGGIRCEKAALYMAQAGIEGVLQLEGGILKYLEETDGRHYEGDCFVFDERRALDTGLRAQGLPPAETLKQDTP